MRDDGILPPDVLDAWYAVDFASDEAQTWMINYAKHRSDRLAARAAQPPRRVLWSPDLNFGERAKLYSRALDIWRAA